MTTVAVLGGAGYAGGELLRLLASHPEAHVTQVTSSRLVGRPVAETHPHLRASDLRFSDPESVEPADVVVSALRHGESSKRIDEIRHLAPIVVDLSADFRLRCPDAYREWYGWEHPRPDLLGSFVYALPELNRERIRDASLLATGGCTATAALLALRPLLRAGVADPAQPLVIDALIGSSAAGSEPSASSHHPHRSGAMRSFAPTGHRHSAEIAQELSVDPSLVALSVTSVEAVRGILVTAHVFLAEDLDERALWRLFREAYAGEPFVRIVKRAQGLHRHPDPRLLSGTNLCDVGFHRDPRSRRVVVTAAIDNLVKGAAGQAVHALNIRLGCDERAGLEFGGLYPL